MLEKILESPLDCKEIQPVSPKGYQPWIFIWGTDYEALVLWPPDTNSRVIWKDPDAGKDWGQEEKGTTEDETVRWHRWLSGHEFEQTPGLGDREAWRAAVHGVAKSRTRLSDWTTTREGKGRKGPYNCPSLLLGGPFQVEPSDLPELRRQRLYQGVHIS